jgi:methionine-rich copper-binding protein CopC
MMTKYLLLMTCLLCSVWANAQAEQLLLMPYPQTIERQQGQLVLSETINFAVEGKKSAATNALVKTLGKRIQQQTGQTLRLKKTAVSKAQLIIRVEDAQPLSNYIAEWEILSAQYHCCEN